ncbi:hypothetical protein MMC22_010917 [Lobaria immixta]|nr:hypothetical protein [Lobaria immixta]
MPVTIHPASHGASIVSYRAQPSEDSLTLLKDACSKEYQECSELLQSSFDSQLQPVVYSSRNGFVHGVILAYSRHHHLRIRPEDVWFAILTQLSFYINKHAEELRGQFVSFEGKKELTVTFLSGNRHTVDFGVFAKEMSLQIEKNVVDKELRAWIMPAFSTTTEHDVVVASVLLMGVVQKYFDFTCMIMCGLPSATLLGERADWELILKRLDKLQTFGAEPTQFCTLLKPVISWFVKSFDNPSSTEVISFWQRVAHVHNQGSGPTFYSGWITAFCFWDQDGNSMYREGKSRRVPNLNLDGVIYHQIDSNEVPLGFSSVPVKVNDNGDEFDAMMVAGSVGIHCTSSGDELGQGLVGLDTVAAKTGWWMFEKKSQEVLDEETREREESGGSWLWKTRAMNSTS